MGWTSIHAHLYNERGNVDRKAMLDERWTQTETEKYPKLTVLKSSMVGSTYYAAIQVERNGKVEQVFGTVALTSVDSKDYFNFSYKDMDETMGPCAYDCPISILKLLTSTENEWANEWRKKCYEKHIEKKSPSALANLPVESVITFVLPYETSAFKKGSEIILRKIAYHGRTTWYGYGYRWGKGVLPKTYIIVTRGSELTDSKVLRDWYEMKINGNIAKCHELESMIRKSAEEMMEACYRYKIAERSC